MKSRWGSVVGLVLALMLACSGTGCTKQMRKSRYLARANSDFQSGQYDRAEVEYMNVLRLGPRTPLALARLGVIYFEEGRFLRAQAALQQAAALEPDNAEVRLKRCLTRLALGNVKEARADAQSILKQQPGQEEALSVLADTAFSQQELQDTRQQLEHMRQGDQDRAGYHLALAGILVKQGQPTNALAELQRAVALDPKSAAAQMALGNWYWLQGEPKLAEPALKAAVELSPVRSGRRIRYAEFKRAQGGAGEGRQMLEALTRKVPDYIPGWLALGQLALDEGRYQDGAAAAESALARAPESLEAMVLKGKVRLAQGDGAQAVAEFTHLSELVPKAPLVQYELALAYSLAGDVSKARARLEQAVALNPNYAEAIVALAELRLRQGETGPVVSSLSALLKQQPQLMQAHFLLAAAYLAQNQPDEAIGVYRRMQQRFPKEPQVPWALATVLARQKQGAEARQLCAQALEMAPDFLAPLQTLVELDLADKQPQAALERVQQQIARRPTSPELQLLMARIHLEQHQTAQAEAPLLKAIELAPNLRTPYQILAQVYVDSQRPQLALEKLTGFVAKTNDVAVLLQIGMIQESLKNYSAAGEAYEKLLTVAPKYAPALNNLAYLYAEYLGQPGKGLAAAEAAHQLLPGVPSATDTLGWVLFRNRDYVRALPLLEEAAPKLGSPEAQFHLGMVRYALGQEAPAREALEAALGAGKDFHGKEEAQSRLAILALDPKTATAADRALLEKRVADAADDVVALGRLARIYDRDGAVDKAVQVYEQVLKQTPKNGPVLARLSELYLGLLKNPQKALELAKDAHAAAPGDAAISQALGHLVLQTGDYKWAASLLQEAANANPNQPDLCFDMAWAQYGLGQLQEATASLQNGLAGGGFSRAEEAKRLLALLGAYTDATQRQAIDTQVKAALKADPNNIAALLVVAMQQEDKGSFSDAKKTLEQILNQSPRFAPGLREMALLCSTHFTNDAKAYDLAMKAREAFPSDANLADALGILAYARANYSSSIQYLKQSLQARPGDGVTLYYLGMAQYQLKAKAESKSALQQALALNIEPKLADQAKRVLAELK